jgi:hypothetical protein
MSETCMRDMHVQAFVRVCGGIGVCVVHELIECDMACILKHGGEDSIAWGDGDDGRINVATPNAF